MLHFIHGTLAKLTGEYAVIDCCGAGFKILISTATCAKIADKAGKDVLLYTYMSVSEDNISLHGFAEEEELELFIKLISVSGIGGNTARTLLSAFTVAELCEAIATGNETAIKSVKGIGLKTAQRLIVDLKDKIKGIGGGVMSNTVTVAAVNNDNVDGAVAALVMLGFPAAAAGKVVNGIAKNEPGATIEQLIKLALKQL